MKTKQISFILLIAVAVTVLIVLSTCRHNDGARPVSGAIRVGIATWAGFGVGYIGEEKALFSGITTSFRVLDDVNARHAAFRSGELDVMVSSADVFAQEVAQGIEGKVILVTDESSGGDGVIARNGINTIKDLRGKRIALARATPSHFLLFKLLQRNGMTIKDISPVTFDDPSQAAQALSGGSVDAAVTFEPFLSQLQADGKGKVIVTTKELPGIIVDVLVASPQFLARKSEFESFISGWVKSAEFAKQNSAEATKAIAKGFKMPHTADVEGMMAGLTFADTKRNRELLCSSGGKSPALVQILVEAAEFWKEQGIITQLPKLEDRISDRTCEVLK